MPHVERRSAKFILQVVGVGGKSARAVSVAARFAERLVRVQIDLWSWPQTRIEHQQVLSIDAGRFVIINIESIAEWPDAGPRRRCVQIARAQLMQTARFE